MKLVISGIVFLACLFNGTKEGSARLLDRNCGISTIDDIEAHIHDGKITTIRENPWMVKISTKNGLSISFVCSGILITTLLTAAHCIFFNDTYLHLGDYLIVDPEPDCTSGKCIPKAYNYRADMKFTHRNYKGRLSKFDIGMYRMEKEVTYSEYVRPICLLVDDQILEAKKFNITGWGKTKQEQPVNRTLQTGTVYPLNSSFCDAKYSTYTDRSQICVGSNSIGSCEGDSGGPLSSMMPYENTNRTFLYGLVSFGSDKCSKESGLSVLTNVTHYMKWIENVIKASEIQYAGNGGFWHKIAEVAL
ncbi:melanization protease 1-like isoform X2 [Drosophila suzukii]|uniref:Melanization protease 1-like isoform X2 n=1 Tax=Drosophila suzukii TaxID=28584 RepID=A0AB40DBR9_DROSZ